MESLLDSEFQIRRLTEADAQVLWDFRLKALEAEPHAFTETAEEHERMPLEVFRDRLAASANDSFVLGAFHRGELVGMTGFYRETHLNRPQNGRIWGVFVSPEFRGKGLGRRLVQSVIEKARAIEGLSSISLTVAATQEPARRLYLSLGFRFPGSETGDSNITGQLEVSN